MIDFNNVEFLKEQLRRAEHNLECAGKEIDKLRGILRQQNEENMRLRQQQQPTYYMQEEGLYEQY